MRNENNGIFRRFQSNAFNAQLGTLLLPSGSLRGQWRMDASYQRGLVWGIERKRKLVESALMGIPISSIIVNHRPVSSATGWELLDYVVDGKQRCAALTGYVDGEFAVPAQWFGNNAERISESIDGVDMVRFGNLSDQGQRMTLAISVPILEVNLATEDEERELFDRLNFGGVPQGESDFS